MSKLTDEQKVKLVYSGELLIIAIVFLVIGILKLLGIMGYDEGRRVFFNYLTSAGGIWFVVDLIWTLVSPKKRAKTCLLDKFLNMPLGIYLIVFNITCFTQPKRPDEFYVVMMCFAFFYIGVDYIFQSVYHWFNPIPQLMDTIEEVEEESNEEEVKEDE